MAAAKLNLAGGIWRNGGWRQLAGNAG